MPSDFAHPEITTLLNDDFVYKSRWPQIPTPPPYCCYIPSPKSLVYLWILRADISQSLSLSYFFGGSPTREEGPSFGGKPAHMYLPIQNIGKQRELNLDREQMLVWTWSICLVSPKLWELSFLLSLFLYLYISAPLPLLHPLFMSQSYPFFLFLVHGKHLPPN